MIYGSPLNLGQQELQNAVVQNLSAAPSAPKLGQVYYNSTNKIEYSWNGTIWRPSDAAALTDGSIQNSALATNPLLRSNHTGTQTASTISDLATTVKAYTLDSFAAPVASVSFGGQRAINGAAAVLGTDFTTLTQVNSLIAAAVAGQTAIKNPVRVYASGSITLSGLQTVDGISLAAGDRVLSGTTSPNIYVAASGAWSIATDSSSVSQWVEGTDILVAEGANFGGSIFRQATPNASLTLSNLTFVQTAKINTYTADGITLSLVGTQFAVNYGTGLTVASSKLAVDATVIGYKKTGTITHDGSTTAFPITHSLNNTCPLVVVRDASGNQWIVDNQATSANALTITWGSAQSNGTVFSYSIFG